MKSRKKRRRSSAEAERVNAIELEKAEYAAATRSSEIYDGRSSNGSDGDEPVNEAKRIENNLARKPLGGGGGRVVKLPAIGKTGLPPVGRLQRQPRPAASVGPRSGRRGARRRRPSTLPRRSPPRPCARRRRRRRRRRRTCSGAKASRMAAAHPPRLRLPRGRGPS